jgi:hypothetical protein
LFVFSQIRKYLIKIRVIFQFILNLIIFIRIGKLFIILSTQYSANVKTNQHLNLYDIILLILIYKYLISINIF